MPDVKKEAVAALNVALDLQEQGKKDRAMKIFQHALALDPSHADILTAYGEFLELHMNDVMRADHYYKIALEISPQHRKALVNIQRTSPLVEEIDQKRFNRIDQKRMLFYTVPDSHPALRRAKKEAYFAHIYHSNAIEGNTLTLMQTRAIIETRVAVGGKSLVEQNEVLGLDAALSYMNSSLVGRVGTILSIPVYISKLHVAFNSNTNSHISNSDNNNSCSVLYLYLVIALYPTENYECSEHTLSLLFFSFFLSQ